MVREKEYWLSPMAKLISLRERAGERETEVEVEKPSNGKNTKTLGRSRGGEGEVTPRTRKRIGP